MTKYLLADPEVSAKVLGFDVLKAGIESIFGTLSTQAMSSQIYGLYTGFVYFTPFFGGLLADRVFGQRKSVYVGGFLMAVGHFLMAFDVFFLLALLFLILGNGCFKPNISTQVGNLYPVGDPRRDNAFTIFYMGINLGAFLSPLVCGTLGQVYGWHYGFGAAGIGMLIGIAVYHFGRSLLPDDRLGMSKKSLAPGEKHEELTSDDKRRIFALMILCVVNIVFWGIYEQQGNTLQLWADQNTDWNFFGLQIPSTWYQSFNPLFIFMFAPFLDMWWSKRSKKGKTSSSVTKMGIGCFLSGAAFIVMMVAAQVVGDGERGSIFWLIATTWLFTMGELYLSPIGLSLVTKVAPARMVSMMMGMWFLSSFFGNYLSGYLGGFYGTMPKESFFLMLTLMGVAAGMVFFAANKPLSRVIGKNL